MYRNVSNRISSPPTVQAEPEDLSSPHPSAPSSRRTSTPIGGSSVPGAPCSPSSSSTAAAAAWALSNNKLLVFCDIVLKHANYPHAFLGQPSLDDEDHAESESSEETKSTILIKNERVSESPLNSVGESARESTRSSTSSTDSVLAELEPEEVDKETFESVTCWCGKPFAGRPMIECDKCLVWYHMSCEQIRRNNIPQLFQCSKCKEKRRQKKRSSSNRDESSRRNSKGSSSGKKRKSSSFSSSSSSGIPGSTSPQSSSDANLSPFPVGLPQENNHHHLPPHHEPTIKTPSSSSSSNSFSLLQETPTKVPPPPPPVAALINKTKDMYGSATPSRPRHRKSKSSPNGVVHETRKNGGGTKKAHPPSVAADSSTEEFRSTVVSDVPLGLSSAAAVVGDVYVPPPGCQPPRLLPCFENSTITHPSSSSATANNNGLSNNQNHSSFDDDESNNHDESSSQTSSLPPPKLQPQVYMTPPSPPPLLLSSNFVVDHQPQTPLIMHAHPHQSKLQIQHHQSPNQTGVIVGGGDSNAINNYQFRP